MPAKIAALLILLGLTLWPLVMIDHQWPGSASAQDPKSWLYLNAFQSRKLIAIDARTGRVESTIEVNDMAGSPGAAVTSDGKTIITVDGSMKSRLRVLTAATRELISEHAFDHRVLWLNHGRTVHLTADDRRLLVKTFDYAAAAKGIRVFDVENRHFLPFGLQERACDDARFASARDGSLIAVCPGFLQELQPPSLHLPGEWIAAKIKTADESPSDVALAGDGSILYVIGSPGTRRPWLLSRWTRGQSEASATDLRIALNANDVISPAPVISLSPDGKMLAIVAGFHIWLVDSTTLHLVGHWLESWPIDRLAFTRDGKEMLAMRNLGGGRAELMRISTSTKDITRLPLDHLGMNFIAGAPTFIVAPAP